MADTTRPCLSGLPPAAMGAKLQCWPAVIRDHQRLTTGLDVAEERQPMVV